MLIGSLAGPLCTAGGFCAAGAVAVEHQRINSPSYTYSAALPAMMATTASETITLLQTNPEVMNQCRENIKSMWAQLDPRSEWMYCTSFIENPMMLLQFKPEVLSARKWNVQEQEAVLQEIVDEV